MAQAQIRARKSERGDDMDDRIEILRQAIEGRDLRHLARRIGVNPATLYRLRAGSTPRGDVVLRLADYLRSEAARTAKELCPRG